MPQRYKSDCECCQFVRQGIDYLGQNCDIFVTTSSEKCVVFRYSDVPWDNRAVGLEYYDMTDIYNFEGMDEILGLLRAK